MLRIGKLTDYATVILATLAADRARLLNAGTLAERTHIAAPTVSKLLARLSNEAVGRIERLRGLDDLDVFAVFAAQTGARPSIVLVTLVNDAPEGNPRGIEWLLAGLERLANRSYDAVILCAPDFPFVQDGTRQDDTFRARQHEWYVRELAVRGIPFMLAEGTLACRVAAIRHNLRLTFNAS